MILNAKILWDRVDDTRRYPYSLQAIKNLKDVDLSASVTIFSGDNGSGKSTLLEAIAVSLGCPAEGGSKNFRFQTRNTHSELHEVLRIARNTQPIKDLFFYRAETFYNFSSEMARLDEDVGLDAPISSRYGGRDLQSRSHGEAVIELFRSRFRGGGVYLMDEPEAALSIGRQLEALVHIHRLTQEGAQFLIATHSPVLLAFPGASIFQFGDEGLTGVEYEDVPFIPIYKRLLNDRKLFVERLLAEQAPEEKE